MYLPSFEVTGKGVGVGGGVERFVAVIRTDELFRVLFSPWEVDSP